MINSIRLFLRKIKKRNCSVFKILRCNTPAEIDKILSSFEYKDRIWIERKVNSILLEDGMNKTKAELKLYKRNVPKWKRNYNMKKFEMCLYK